MAPVIEVGGRIGNTARSIAVALHTGIGQLRTGSVAQREATLWPIVRLEPGNRLVDRAVTLTAIEAVVLVEAIEPAEEQV